MPDQLEIKFKVKDPSGKLLAVEIFNAKFGWHFVYGHDAKKDGYHAPIHLGTYPDKIGEINLREQFER
jgi:hypothetical protein